MNLTIRLSVTLLAFSHLPEQDMDQREMDAGTIIQRSSAETPCPIQSDMKLRRQLPSDSPNHARWAPLDII